MRDNNAMRIDMVLDYGYMLYFEEEFIKLGTFSLSSASFYAVAFNRKGKWRINANVMGSFSRGTFTGWIAGDIDMKTGTVVSDTLEWDSTDTQSHFSPATRVKIIEKINNKLKAADLKDHIND